MPGKGPSGISAQNNTLEFFYDIVCPYAYIAASRIEDLATRAGATVIYRPVSLGGIYDLTKAPQGKDGSATSNMSPAKLQLVNQDFLLQIQRYHVPYSTHPRHPVKTIDALRLIYAVPHQYRGVLTRALFKAYHVDNAAVDDHSFLMNLVHSLGIPLSTKQLDFSVFSMDEYRQELRDTTRLAVERGAPGVPAFWLPNNQHLYWGQDRLHFVEAALTANSLGIPFEKVPNLVGLVPRCLRTPPSKRVRSITFYFDVSSPWAYLAFTQIPRLRKVQGEALKIIYKPILVGALFRAIGTPMVPMSVMSKAKQDYMMQDLQDYAVWWNAVNKQAGLPGVQFQWPDNFPIQGPTALRCIIYDERCLEPIFHAAWRDNQDISNPEVLSRVLSAAGLPGPAILDAVNRNVGNVKEQLRRNTEEAVAQGVIGVPTFKARIYKYAKNGMPLETPARESPLIWGGDRLGVLQDFIQGWDPISSPHLVARVAATSGRAGAQKVFREDGGVASHSGYGGYSSSSSSSSSISSSVSRLSHSHRDEHGLVLMHKL